MSAGLRLLIVTAYRTPRFFDEFVASRSLLRGLAMRGIEWTWLQPSEPQPSPSGWDAVLCWPYRHTIYRRFISYSTEVEERFRDAGRPAINPARHGCVSDHSHFLRAWSRAGLPCADFQKFDGLDQIALDYPLILRQNGLHRGEGMALVHSADEARRAIDERRQAALKQDPADRPSIRPYDLAIRFVDTRGSDGFYRKRRCYVVGDRVIPCHLFVARSWRVNFAEVERSPEAIEEHKVFMRSGEPLAAMLRRAARASGSDLLGIDYTRREDGSYVLWEGNRMVNMAGDGRGYDYRQEARPCDLAYGEAVADLVIERVRRAAAAIGSSNPPPSANASSAST